MALAKVYNQEGKAVREVSLPSSVFEVPWNKALISQVIVSMQGNARPSVAHTKTRGEVRGGGKKPWAQKGTGRARHGSIRSPLWRGGGTTFGPRSDKDYSRKINKKMKTKALYTILSRKFKEGEILFLEELKLSEAKTVRAKEVLAKLAHIEGFEGLATRRKNRALITTPSKDITAQRSFKNFGNIALEEIRNINPLSLLTYKYVVLTGPEEVFQSLMKNKDATSV